MQLLIVVQGQSFRVVLKIGSPEKFEKFLRDDAKYKLRLWTENF